jgi:Flp pilus assembly protein TadD
MKPFNTGDRAMKNACSQRSLGRVALSQDDYDRASLHFSKALSRNPLHADVWFSLGYCHLKLGHFSEATHAFTRTVQLDATHGEAWNNLGVLHLKAERFAPAMIALRVALKHKQATWHVRSQGK